MLSVSPSLFFSHKVHKIRFEKQIRILSQLTVTKFGLPVSESSTRISKFYDSNDSEQMILNINFIKQESKIGCP